MSTRRVRVRTVLALCVVTVVVAVTAAAAAPTRSPPPAGQWVGWIDAHYIGSGSTNNGNCGSCLSRSNEDAYVSTDFSRAAAQEVGTVTLQEATGYNSQCGGETTRVEHETGGVRQRVTKDRSGVSVSFLGGARYRLQISPPGIPYGGTITEEKVTRRNGQPSCSDATRTSSGVFYFPAIEKPIVRSSKSLTRLDGSFTYDPSSCQYPRTVCKVTLEWAFGLSRSEVPENPALPHH